MKTKIPHLFVACTFIVIGFPILTQLMKSGL
jgi:hypothetical protein